MAKGLQVNIMVKTNVEAKTRLMGIIAGTLLDNLKAIGIELSESHPCRAQGGCGISVDYDAKLMVTVIKHHLGDNWDRREMSNVGRNNSNWPMAVTNALSQMHMSQVSGYDHYTPTPKIITPYISKEDAIEIASEIYEHTGQRVTIPAGGKKGRGWA